MTAIGEGEVEGDTDLHLLGDSGVGDLIDTANGLGSPPVADAGVDIVASGGEVIELDGSASTDPDGDELTYQWALTTLPTSSYATIINADTADQADFYADVEGVYIATLVVFDGSFSASDEVQITISQPNEAPVASAGADQYVTVGDTVQLNGSSSFPAYLGQKSDNTSVVDSSELSLALLKSFFEAEWMGEMVVADRVKCWVVVALRFAYADGLCQRCAPRS